jgi:regulator of nonsense transcripts 3
MPPKPMVLLAKKGANHHADSSGQPQQQHSAKQNHQPKNTARLKLVVRRLPPALTKDEFLSTLGDDWKVPGNKIDWLDYRCGKTKAPGKLSLQSRAYLHLTNDQHVKPFEAHFLQLSFHDAKGSHKDPQLKQLLPSLAFAPNQRIPSLKQRQDGRQGTIDQDPEFIAFLERETQPVTKPLSLDQALAQEKPKDKISSTPLLDDLREKKQNKARANQKHKEEKQSDKSSARGRDHKSDAKQPVKLLAKDKKNQPAQPAAPTPPAATPASGRKRERAAPNSNNIKSMLQRDLGLNPPTKRGGKDVPAANTSKTTSPAPTMEPATSAAVAAPAKPTKSRSGRNKDKAAAPTTAQENSKPAAPAPTGILKKPAQPPAPKAPKAAKGNNNPAQAPPSAPAPTNKQSKAAASAGSSSTTKAYLKHANASQGVTEALLLTALSAFGPVVKVEIDKRKGTALAEFKDNEGLKAAMSKKSVPVAQGAVEVLEYRDKQAQGGRNAQANNNTTRGANGNTSNRGRGGRARGGAAAAGNTTATPNGNGPSVATNGNKADAT